jgi:uncharacterized SAM-binding protein YcdF (DUF218 family)
VKGAYPFLAITHRVGDADALVVEGWVHDYAIQAAADEFRSGSYRRVFTTGGPVVGIGGYINDFRTSASVGADLLKKAGVPNESLQMIPSHTIDRDRTYSSAIALRVWIQEHQPSVRRINVVTENTHARRTCLLFQKALGKHVQVGIIAVPNPDYDNRHWWRYSEGVKDVGSEALAYVYARLFFSSFGIADSKENRSLQRRYHTMKIVIIGLRDAGPPLAMQFPSGNLRISTSSIGQKKIALRRKFFLAMRFCSDSNNRGGESLGTVSRGYVGKSRFVYCCVGRHFRSTVRGRGLPVRRVGGERARSA